MGKLEITPLEVVELMLEDCLAVEGRFEISQPFVHGYWQDDPPIDPKEMIATIERLLSEPISTCYKPGDVRLRAKEKLDQFAAKHNCLYRINFQTGNITFYRI